MPAWPACRGGCRTEPALRAHHDRLLLVETDADAMLELFELAVTWSELEYPADTTVAPPDWIRFAEVHRWRDQDRVERIFALATDVALRGRRRVGGLGMAAGDGLSPRSGPATPGRSSRLRIAAR
ncbi:hypothetical protein [Pseudonocardia sp. H11422]|uniref:hypothetical protein n=1 Tax=Pseudonocardia sp. H11422 TaxID=2835866 RepID=UPI001BDD6790|nr:hypothetical protein [Pseudonocardia sp. H11422]